MADSGIQLKHLLPTNLDELEQAVDGEIRIGREHSQPGVAWGFVRSTAADRIRDVLDCDAIELIATGWSKAVELRQSDRQTRGQTTIVHLGKHNIKTSVHPVLTVGFNLPPHVALRFTLEVTAHFKAVALSVRDGYILAADTGQASVSAQLLYKKAKLHGKQESPTLLLPGRYTFKDPGIRIG